MPNVKDFDFVAKEYLYITANGEHNKVYAPSKKAAIQMLKAFIKEDIEVFEYLNSGTN